MAQPTGMHERPLAEDLAPLRSKWGWVLALGGVYVLAGVAALGSVATATTVSVYLVGFMMVLAGVSEVFGAFLFKAWSRFLLWLGVGVLYIAGGVAAFQNPRLAAVFLTLVLGVSLVCAGVLKIVVAFAVKQENAWTWVALSGLVTALLGGIILAGWPVSGIYVLGLFLGIDLILAGAAWVRLAFGLRRPPPTGRD